MKAIKNVVIVGIGDTIYSSLRVSVPGDTFLQLVTAILVGINEG